MPYSSIGLLQFDEFIELLRTYAGSEDGKDLVSGLAPHSERASLEADLAEAGEAIAYLREISGAQQATSGAAIRLRFDQIRPIGGCIRILRVEGASLEGVQIRDLFATLMLAGEYRGILQRVAGRYPLLALRSSKLADLRDLARRYGRVFLPDGSLSDEASVALGRIRRDIVRQQKSIQESLERFLRAHRGDGTLQEDFVTIREDRFVVPITAGQKGRVNGVIHGSSGTGRTLYVEPLETIDLNNHLVRLREEELREIERILAEITGSLREHTEEIAATATTLAELDCVFAKAAFARVFDAVIPRFSKGVRKLTLREARHPLLESILRKQNRPIIPISFELDDSRRCLLISGPNTGGKTVTLKTTGLLTLLAHSAIPVPCAEAEFPLFDDVLADIGDYQSIAESLSGFSGHLLHVKDMLEHVTANSLVLLDELGRSTDPDEGGALGVALLDEFHRSGAFTLASTHLLPMKLYGSRTPGVLNASMGFDDASLAPTYELRLGVPGKSAGLDIATRLEMPAEVLAHARAVLPRMQSDFEKLLNELHHQIEENARRSHQLEETTAELKKRQAAVEAEAVKREQQRQREWERKSESIVADFEARAQAMMEQVSRSAESRKAAEQAQRLVAKTRREFREEAAEAIARDAVAVPSASIEEGTRVRLKDIREIATVRRILKNGLLEVEAGFLKMQVPRSDVVEVVGGNVKEPSHLPSNVRLDTGPRWDTSYREINVIGQRAEEALEQVDKFLDSAALASVNRVRIIHGHGMGVLKRAVGEFLKTNPHVSRSYPAPPAEGGTGATVVELRE
jgi:DNA mismatch repair protein MutS2